MSAGDSTLLHLFAELRRRKVWQVAAIYAVVAAGVIGVANDALPRLQLPDWTVTFVIVLTILGFPIALALAWTYDITRGGIERTTARAEEAQAVPDAQSEAVMGAGRDDESGPVASAPSPSRWRAVSYAVIGMVIVAAGGALALPHVFGGSGATRRPEIRSLAVLPFEDYAEDSTQAYFADGMTEALRSELGHISALKVISRTSAMQYKGVHKALPEIARELDVDALVEGSVMRTEGRVRITPELIYGPTDEQLWSDEYERDMTDVLSLQSDVARAIAREVQARLKPEEQIRLAGARRPVDPRAYDEYLKGRYEMGRMTSAATKRALAHLKKSVLLAPEFAPAHAWLGWTYLAMAQQFGLTDYEGGLRLGRREAERALELDPNLGDAHVVLGGVHFVYDWDWEAAERQYRLAVELDPGSVWAHLGLAFYLGAMGERDAVIPEAERALVLDPMGLDTRTGVCEMFVDGSLFERGERECQHVLELDPTFVRARVYLQHAYEGQGRFDEAIATWEEVDTGRELATDEEYRRAYRERGSRGYWETMVKRSTGWSRLIALAQLGRVDDLLPILEREYQARSSRVSFLRMWYFDPVREDPKFQAFLKRVGLD